MRVQSLSHDCLIGGDRFQAVIGPAVVDGQRTAGLRFGNRRALALLDALCLFAGPPKGFRQRDIRGHVTALQGRASADYGPGALSYDLRASACTGSSSGSGRTHRYRVTATGLRTALLFVSVYARALRPALEWNARSLASRSGRAAYQRLQRAMDAYLTEAHLAA